MTDKQTPAGFRLSSPYEPYDIAFDHAASSRASALLGNTRTSLAPYDDRRVTVKRKEPDVMVLHAACFAMVIVETSEEPRKMKLDERILVHVVDKAGQKYPQRPINSAAEPW